MPRMLFNENHYCEFLCLHLIRKWYCYQKNILLYLNICEILTHKWFSGSLQSVEIWAEVFFNLLKWKMRKIYVKQTLQDFSRAVCFLWTGTHIDSIFSALSRGENWDRRVKEEMWVWGRNARRKRAWVT